MLLGTTVVSPGIVLVYRNDVQVTFLETREWSPRYVRHNEPRIWLGMFYLITALALAVAPP
jgi:hypothetical protein